MKFLADMNISTRTVVALHTRGMDVVRVSDIVPPNSSDDAVLDEARRTTSVLLTQDLDFSSLLALGGYSAPSVVSLRLPVPEPLRVADRLLEVLPVLEGDLLSGCIAVVDDRAVRIRLLPIDREP